MDSMGTNKMKCQIGRWVLIYSAVVFGLFCVAGCQPFLDDDVSLHSYQNARQLNFTPVDFKNLSKQPTFVLRACNINQSFHFFHELTQDCGVAIYCNLKVGDGHSENFYSSADFILTGLFVITIDDKIKDLFIMEPVYGTLNIDKQSGAVEISINREPSVLTCPEVILEIPSSVLSSPTSSATASLKCFESNLPDSKEMV